MAFTKITNAGFGLTTGTLVGVAASFSSTVSVGGTLTYEDVTNVDSVGLITARNGINIQSAGLTVVGVTTLSSTKSQFDSTGSLYLNSGGSANSGNYLAKVGSDGSADFLSNISIADKIIHYGDTNTAIRFPAADTFSVETGGAERLRVDSSGRLLVGSDTTITDDNFGIGNLQVTDKTGFQHVLFSGHSASASNATALSLGRSRGTQSSPAYLSSGDHIARFSATSYNGGNYGSSGCIDFYAADQHASNDLPGYIAFKTVPDGSATLTERLRIDSSGNVGINATSYTAKLHVSGAYNQTGLKVLGGGAGYSSPLIVGAANGTEYMRVDDDGRLLLGTSTARANFFNSTDATQFQIEGTDSNNSALSLTRNSNSTGYAPLHFAKSRGTSVGSNTIVQSGDYLGGVIFSGSDGSEFVTAASIHSVVDGTPGANDMPGRLSFHTTADGASTPTERMRIASNGQLLINTDSPANSDTNIEVHDTSVPEFALARNDTSITAGNSLGRIRFYGNDSNGTFQECARISATADGTHQTDDKATRLTFWTTEGGNSTPTERLRIHQLGHGEFHSGAITRVLVGDDVSVVSNPASKNVTGIPSWATKITIIFYRVSLSGTADILVRLRASGSAITSGYVSGSANDTGTINDTSTSGFIISNSNASHKTSGRMVIERVGTDTKWVSSHTMVIDGGTPRHGAGDLSSYSGTIDGITVLDTGSNSFDNGTVTVIAEA